MPVPARHRRRDALNSPAATSSRAEASGPLAAHARLVAAIRDRPLFGHPVLRVEAIETHISTILLAGEFAYKLKKPVDLGFVDFTTLEKRRRCCEEELRLNRRTAPQLYVGVVPISGSVDRPVVAGEGTPIEYAVKMRRFAPDATLDALLQRGALAAEQIDQLAALVAHFHQSSPVAAPADGYGARSLIEQAALDNFRQTRAYVGDRASLEALARLEAWTQAEFDRLGAAFEERQRRGFVRECHGDLHLGNVALIDDRPVPFDCIEFSAPLRWIDVMSEAAFTVMDLLAHSERALGFRFLNAYLEATGDYEGVGVLRFYLVYRALVRAKVAAIQQRNADLDRYLRLAETLARGPAPALVLTCGLSGSGKTTIARSLAGRLGAVHIRADVERKRLHGIEPMTRADAAVDAGIYAPQATAATYERLAQLARSVLASGFPVIADATFLRRAQRSAFRDLAGSMGARFVIVRSEAPLDALRARLIARAPDASDATAAVLDRQRASEEGFTRAEAGAVVVCETLERKKCAATLAGLAARLSS
jgi:aminoglycoside phosphotransferase family enzyme/predicted kinase